MSHPSHDWDGAFRALPCRPRRAFHDQVERALWELGIVNDFDSIEEAEAAISQVRAHLPGIDELGTFSIDP